MGVEGEVGAEGLSVSECLSPGHDCLSRQEFSQ